MKQTFSSDPASFGRFFHVRLNGSSLDDIDRQVLSELRPIGVQLTDRNFLQDACYEEMLVTLKALLEDVYSQTGRKEMLVSIDHEGGRVHRLPKPFTHFPFPAEYTERAYEVGRAMALELHSLGINLSFSPSADVNSNPSNPVIGKRSFHDNPAIVAQAAVDFAQGLKDVGLISCGKHFPGHGDTQVDSHFGLPKLDFDEERLSTCELRPFEELIRWGVPMIMTAHILFPKLDRKLPATLSKEILQTFLRTRLQFDGVVITDDLDMQAIADHYNESVIAQHALPAGCDLLLLNHHPIRGLEIARQMFRNLDQGVLSLELLESSAARVDSLFHEYRPGSTVAPLPPALFEEHAELRRQLMIE